VLLEARLVVAGGHADKAASLSGEAFEDQARALKAIMARRQPFEDHARGFKATMALQ